MVTRKRQLLLAVVAVSATGTALPACSNGNVPVCHGFTANQSTCGNAGPAIDAGIDDGSPDGGSATDAHVANDSPSDGSIE